MKALVTLDTKDTYTIEFNNDDITSVVRTLEESLAVNFYNILVDDTAVSQKQLGFIGFNRWKLPYMKY